MTEHEAIRLILGLLGIQDIRDILSGNEVLHEILKRYKSSPQWIKCTPETMPPQMENVLVYAEHKEIAMGQWFLNKWVIFGDETIEDRIKFKIIAWMPLPSPPEE